MTDVDLPVRVMDYHEHAMTAGADARAACYGEVRVGDSPTGFGAGIDVNLVTASLRAVVSGVSRHRASRQTKPTRPDTALAARGSEENRCAPPPRGTPGKTPLRTPTTCPVPRRPPLRGSSRALISCTA